MKVDFGCFQSSSLRVSEGGVTPRSFLKLMAGRLRTGFCDHLSTKNRQYKSLKLPDLSRIAQHFVSKSGRVTSNAIENYWLLCDFWKRTQVRKHYKLTAEQLQKYVFVVQSCFFSQSQFQEAFMQCLHVWQSNY